MPAQASLTLNLTSLLTSAVAIGTAQHAVQLSPGYSFIDGSGADQVSRVWSATRTLAASANEDLDLNGGALTDALGQALAFTKVRGLLVLADAANTNNVIVGGAASNGFVTPFGGAAHTLTVRPGGMQLLVARDATAYVVTPATGDLLRIANSGAGSSVSYSIVLLGS